MSFDVQPIAFIQSHSFNPNDNDSIYSISLNYSISISLNYSIYIYLHIIYSISTTITELTLECLDQIPGNLEEVHLACVRGAKTKHDIALRNAGCLPATVRLCIEDAEDALGRPLTLVRSLLDDSLLSCGGSGGGRGGGGGCGKNAKQIFRVKPAELVLAPGQVTKVSLVFAPQECAGRALGGAHGGVGGREGDYTTSGGDTRHARQSEALTHKSTLVLRVVEDAGVHYCVPLRGHAAPPSPTPPTSPHTAASPPGLPLSYATSLTYGKGGGVTVLSAADGNMSPSAADGVMSRSAVLKLHMPGACAPARQRSPPPGGYSVCVCLYIKTSVESITFNESCLQMKEIYERVVSTCQ